MNKNKEKIIISFDIIDSKRRNPLESKTFRTDVLKEIVTKNKINQEQIYFNAGDQICIILDNFNLSLIIQIFYIFALKDTYLRCYITFDNIESYNMENISFKGVFLENIFLENNLIKNKEFYNSKQNQIRVKDSNNKDKLLYSFSNLFLNSLQDCINLYEFIINKEEVFISNKDLLKIYINDINEEFTNIKYTTEEEKIISNLFSYLRKMETKKVSLVEGISKAKAEKDIESFKKYKKELAILEIKWFDLNEEVFKYLNKNSLKQSPYSKYDDKFEIKIQNLLFSLKNKFLKELKEGEFQKAKNTQKTFWNAKKILEIIEAKNFKK